MRVRDWSTVDFYAILGLEPAASAEEIAAAFRTLAKRLHPDRVGATVADSERFKSVTAAYDVLGDVRLRRSYDDVRRERSGRATTTTTVGGVGAPRADSARPPTAERARRTGRRWLAAGIVTSLVGILVAGLVAHFQVGERAHRSGRVRTEAVLLVLPSRHDVRFTTAGGEVVQVLEPDRVNPGAERNGQRIGVLYRPDRPTDVILDESTAARDITLWIVAVKLLVGGAIFLGVGIRRLRPHPPLRGAATDARARARGPDGGRPPRGGDRP